MQAYRDMQYNVYTHASMQRHAVQCIHSCKHAGSCGTLYTLVQTCRDMQYTVYTHASMQRHAHCIHSCKHAETCTLYTLMQACSTHSWNHAGYNSCKHAYIYISRTCRYRQTDLDPARAYLISIIKVATYSLVRKWWADSCESSV